jgi:ectoine hydroxylase-related dioxygenase (phytanoyl-CoA dioxygenase family)
MSHAQTLERDGYSIMHDALPSELCEKLVIELTTMANTWPRSLVQAFHGVDTVRHFDLLNAADIFQAVPAQPEVLAAARDVLGQDCQLGSYGTVAVGSGATAQPIHCDDMLYRLERPHPDVYLNVMIALDDFTEANGATRVVPGSHRWPDNPPLATTADVDDAAHFDSIAVEMPRGSVCFILGSTYHGAGANHTPDARHAMTLAYCAPWVRAQENFLVSVSQERAAGFDPELRKLMGYQTGHGTSLGHIFNGPTTLTGPLASVLVHD